MPFDVTPINGAARAAMKRAGLTERDVQRASGLDAATVRQLLDDCTDVYCRDFRARFAQALRVSEAELWHVAKPRPHGPASSAPTFEADDDDETWSPPRRPAGAPRAAGATNAQPVTWLDVERGRR